MLPRTAAWIAADQGGPHDNVRTSDAGCVRMSNPRCDLRCAYPAPRGSASDQVQPRLWRVGGVLQAVAIVARGAIGVAVTGRRASS